MKYANWMRGLALLMTLTAAGAWAQGVTTDTIADREARPAGENPAQVESRPRRGPGAGGEWRGGEGQRRGRELGGAPRQARVRAGQDLGTEGAPRRQGLGTMRRRGGPGAVDRAEVAPGAGPGWQRQGAGQQGPPRLGERPGQERGPARQGLRAQGPGFRWQARDGQGREWRGQAQRVDRGMRPQWGSGAGMSSSRRAGGPADGAGRRQGPGLGRRWARPDSGDSATCPACGRPMARPQGGARARG